MDTQTEDLRRFWSRVIFFAGMLWGFVPLIVLPQSMIANGPNAPTSHLVAEIVNRLTVFPASVLAFWHRRFASLWLIADSVVILYAVSQRFPSTLAGRAAAVIIVVSPLLLGAFGLVSGMLGWPPLLERKQQDQASSAVR